MTDGTRLAAFLVMLTAAFALAGAAEAGNRKAFKALTEEAEAYCERIRADEVYDCSVEKCPCSKGLREVQRFDKLRTRPACVCTPDTDRARANEAAATDFCVDWNFRNAKDGDRCFVMAATSCPEGTAPLGRFDRRGGRGPYHTACRGVPPEEKAAEEEEDMGEAEEAPSPEAEILTPPQAGGG